jgi:hypothetical protein
VAGSAQFGGGRAIYDGYEINDQSLSLRIEELDERLEVVPRPSYTVSLTFTDETNEEFYAQHSGARGPDGRRRKAAALTFGNEPVPSVE